MTTAQLLGEHFKILRAKAGLTIDDVAASAGRHRRTILKLEAGETNPNLFTLEDIAKAYKCTLAELFEPWAKAHAPVENEMYCRKLRLIMDKSKEQGDSLKTILNTMIRDLK